MPKAFLIKQKSRDPVKCDRKSDGLTVDVCRGSLGDDSVATDSEALIQALHRRSRTHIGSSSPMDVRGRLASLAMAELVTAALIDEQKTAENRRTAAKMATSGGDELASRRRLADVERQLSRTADKNNDPQIHRPQQRPQLDIQRTTGTPTTSGIRVVIVVSSCWFCVRVN